MKRKWLAAGLLAFATIPPAFAQEAGSAGGSQQAAPRIPPVPYALSKRPELTKSAYRKLQDAASKVAAGERGRVVLGLCLQADGTVTDAKVVVSSGYPRLDRLTEDLATKLTFTPALDRDGKPIAMCDPRFPFPWQWD